MFSEPSATGKWSSSRLVSFWLLKNAFGVFCCCSNIILSCFPCSSIRNCNFLWICPHDMWKKEIRQGTYADKLHIYLLEFWYALQASYWFTSSCSWSLLCTSNWSCSASLICKQLQDKMDCRLNQKKFDHELYPYIISLITLLNLPFQIKPRNITWAGSFFFLPCRYSLVSRGKRWRNN